jgi:hypothetical protein
LATKPISIPAFGSGHLPYHYDAGLDRQAHDLLRGIDNEADFRHYFTEADFTDRS